MPLFLPQDWSYEDRNQPISLDRTPVSFGDYASASFQEAKELNPMDQLSRIYELRSLGVSERETTTDEFGNTREFQTLGLPADDPRARRLTLEEANKAGEEMGLRFSEPPTQGQFDYLADLKRKENSRARILSNSPSYGASATGFLAGLAATAIDPLNIAVGFVPVVGEARYARLVAQLGRGGGRLVKGAIEGGVGTAAIVPITAYQASILQQHYGTEEAFMDLVMGTALGSGLHWAGGAVNDVLRGRFNESLNETLRRLDPGERWATRVREDRRTTRVQEGDNAARHDSLSHKEKAQVLNTAVKAVESDQSPKIDELFSTSPKMADLAIPDRRFQATVKLRSYLAASDYATDSRAASIITMSTQRLLEAAKKPATPQGVFDYFAKRFKKLNDYSLKTVPPAEFGQRVGNILEHPEQRVAIEEGSKTILVTEGASLGAVRHAVEEALDNVQNVRGDRAGGYRYRKTDVDGMNAHRAAIAELMDEAPDRLPQASDPRAMLDSVANKPEPIMGGEGPKSSAQIDEVVNRDKDVKLETLVKDEEVGAIESLIAANEGRVKDLGIMDKVIPAEDRQIMLEDAARSGHQAQVKSLFSLANQIAEEGQAGKSVSGAELLMRAGPKRLGEMVTGEKSAEVVIKEVEDTGLVTRVNAAKDIQLYLKRSKLELSGEALERAIKAVQVGDDIDAAVNVALRGNELLAKADEAAASPAPEVAELRAPGEENADDEFGDSFNLEDSVSELAEEFVETLKLYDKRDLVKGEAAIVKEEHDALEANAKTRDLASSVERDEFDEADRNRALRQGDGAAPSVQGEGAGGGGAGVAAPAQLQAALTGRDGKDLGGAEPAIERERTAPGGERPAPETTLSYGGWAVPRRVITPDSSIEVSITPRVVELRDLVHAEGDLQVRDRSRKESKIEALNRANKLDPEQLLPNRVADAGAPIVVERGDGTYLIISGNGRVQSLRQVYTNEALGFKAQAYRERIGPAADGYRSPILVSLITDKLSHDELVRFAERANRSRIAEMSVTEKAQRDADIAGPEVMGLYQGGDFSKKENQPFLRAFMSKVVTAQERGDMSKNGVLTKPGLDRLNAAVLAAAYDDTGGLSLMLESADINTKSIANGYRDVAPSFMKLRSEIAQGLVREDMDITSQMMEAIHFVEKARQEGTKIANALAQIDALNPIDPVVDRLIRQFYNPQLTRANSSLRIAQMLQSIVDAAREKRTGGFLEDSTSIADVIDTAERRFAREADEEVLATADENRGGSDGVGRQEASQPAPDQSRPVADLGGARRGAEAPARPAAEERAGAAPAVSAKVDQIFEQFKADVAKIAQPTPEPVAPSELRTQLEGMKVPEIRAKAKAEGVAAKGRSKEQIIDSYMKSVEAKAAEPKPELPAAKPVPSTLSDFAKSSGWASAADRMDALKDDGASLLKRGAFLGKAKVIAERLVKKADMLQSEILARDLEGAGDTLRDMVDDAARLTELDPRPEANVITQWVRSAAREVNIANREAEALKDVLAVPERPRTVETPEGAVRTAFYDLLEGGKPLKGSAQLAKELGIDPNQAYLLLDEAENLGWIKLKDNGVYVRVPRERRPPRPDAKFDDGEAMALRAFHSSPYDIDRLSIDYANQSLTYPQGLHFMRNAQDTVQYGDKLYEVEIDVDPGQIVQWWKPFSDQPMLAALEASGLKRRELNRFEKALDVGELFAAWGDLRDNSGVSDRDISTSLLANGVKGVEYQDGHIVIFDDSLVTITHKNGEPVTATERADVLKKMHGEAAGEVPRGWGQVDGLTEAERFERDLQSSLAIQRAVTDGLKRVPAAVRIEVIDRMEIEGFGPARGGMFAYTMPSGIRGALIQVLRGVPDAVNVVNHEIFHSMRALGLFSKLEWRIVREAAAEAGGLKKGSMARYEPYMRMRAERMDLHPGLDRHFIDDKLAEEWAAIDFGRWSEKRGSERETAIGRLWGRVKDFIEDLRQAFTNIGRRARGLQEKPSLEQIYRAIEDGSFARRYQEWGLDRVGIDNPLSVNRQAGNEFAAFINDDMRALAHDDSESVAKAVETALTHMSPCAAYHL
jgi:hypothetical protein